MSGLAALDCLAELARLRLRHDAIDLAGGLVLRMDDCSLEESRATSPSVVISKPGVGKSGIYLVVIITWARYNSKARLDV